MKNLYPLRLGDSRTLLNPKTFNRTFLAIAAAFAVQASVVYGQPPTATPPTMANPAPTQASSSASASLDQIIELTGQLDQKLLTTVYWCLGTLVGIFLLLIGLNWFTNFRMHEREVAGLRNELSAGLENARSALEQANAKVIEELKNNLADAAKVAAAEAVGPLQNQLSTIQSTSDGFKAKFVSQEVDMWAAQAVYWNAIRAQLNYLQLVRKTSAWDFNSGLDKLGALLSKA